MGVSFLHFLTPLTSFNAVSTAVLFSTTKSSYHLHRKHQILLCNYSDVMQLVYFKAGLPWCMFLLLAAANVSISHKERRGLQGVGG